MRKISVFASCLALGLALLSSCNNSDTSMATSAEEAKPKFDLTVAKTEIEAANKEFMKLVAAGDSVGIANAYTTDGKVMFAGAPSVVGRANIQTTFSRIINSGVTKIDLQTKDVFGTEDLLVEEGEVTVFVGDNAVAEEKYIILWKKEDGKWKLFRDIANSNR